MKLFYSADYAAAAHEFDTTRKALWIYESLVSSPIPAVELVAPASLTPDDTLTVYSAEYVGAVRTGRPRELAESQGFPWDRRLWRMVAASNGGVVAAALAALTDGTSGTLSIGMHHARHDRGRGFCTLNGLVIAARAALRAGAGRVLVLDLDAHAGGGTASLIADEPRIWQRDICVVSYDLYERSNRLAREYVSEAQRYLPTVERVLAALDRDGEQFDLCLYNAGMDPFEGCAIGGRRRISAAMLGARERMVFAWCRSRALPVAFALAGGYEGPDLERALLVELHRATIAHAARC